jgi:hypothetical protein
MLEHREADGIRARIVWAARFAGLRKFFRTRFP